VNRFTGITQIRYFVMVITISETDARPRRDTEEAMAKFREGWTKASPEAKR
jgi:hypothetical protein